VWAMVHPSFGADIVAWGSAVNGVQLGISFDPATPKSELRVFLRNSGAARVEVLIGHLVGKGTSFSFRFLATAPDGKQREGFEINNFTPIAGLVLPAVVRLDPGGMHELRIPLKKIICIERPGDITFETLVKQRYSLHVSLETDDRGAKWAELSHPWIGKLTSGELGPPN
jgi:hypothetical protein